ncbi:ABC transporter permease [Achromobacter sp. GG226]|uniref:ABC transporter permease n=1 Tax=Verticiella alkaliphila TaxID=2779529 RepID=UPI001C0B56CE|nr:ABC transporter permease [Verticiella sp. GG226]MBU4612094.1 ABC transporter permease [Verticiella sp. GG226]
MNLMRNTLFATWRFRGLVRAISERDLRARYTGSLLGPAWLILQPLSMILIYTLVFSQVMHARLPGEHTSAFAYSVFICAGLITWGFFVEITTRTKGIFLEHANLIKKVQFPKLVLLVPVVVVALFNFLILTGLYFIFLLLVDAWPGWIVLWALPSIAALTFLALAIGLLAGVLHVFVRDVGQTVDIALQLLFWGTPIVYPITILSDWMREIVYFNPVVRPITNLQQLFLNGTVPTLESLAYTVGIASVLAVLAIIAYKRLYAEMLDYL